MGKVTVGDRLISLRRITCRCDKVLTLVHSQIKCRELPINVVFGKFVSHLTLSVRFSLAIA